MSCTVLIGNGPSVLGRGMGKAIDGYTIVARMNNFRTEGFEEDVGSKTDVWVRNCAISTKGEPRAANILLAPAWGRPERAKRVHAHYKSLSLEVLQLVPAHFAHELSAAMGLKGRYPTTGAIAVWWWLEMGGVEKVDVAGIDFFQGQQHHYFKKGGRNVRMHNPEVEEKFFRKLEKQGRVRFL